MLNSAALARIGLLIYYLARKQVAANAKVKMASLNEARNFRCCGPTLTRWRKTMAAA